MGKIKKISIIDFKQFVEEYNNNADTLENKSNLAIKLHLKKQLKFVEKALLTIPTTKQGKESLIEHLESEKLNATRYIPKYDTIRKLDMTICHYASLGMVLVALSETKNHEVAEMELQDIKNNQSLQLNDALRFAHYKRSAEMILKRDGVVLQNIVNPRAKAGFFIVHGIVPTSNTSTNEDPAMAQNSPSDNAEGPTPNCDDGASTQETDIAPSNFEDFDM